MPLLIAPPRTAAAVESTSSAPPRSWHWRDRSPPARRDLHGRRIHLVRRARRAAQILEGFGWFACPPCGTHFGSFGKPPVGANTTERAGCLRPEEDTSQLPTSNSQKHGVKVAATFTRVFEPYALGVGSWKLTYREGATEDHPQGGHGKHGAVVWWRHDRETVQKCTVRGLRHATHGS